MFSNQKQKLPVFGDPRDAVVADKNWQRTSYSSLSGEHTIVSRPLSDKEIPERYDRFVFREMRRGAHTGDLLHYIFVLSAIELIHNYIDAYHLIDQCNN